MGVPIVGTCFQYQYNELGIFSERLNSNEYRWEICRNDIGWESKTG